MNIDTNSSSAFQNQRLDAKSYKWLWIIILSGLCICLIFAGSAIYKFFIQNEPQIYITTGKLDGTIYTNSDESFTCDFMNYITPDILLRDSTENGVGKIDLYNSVTSVNITVQYLIASNDIQDLLNNQANYREGISALVENIDNGFKARFPNSNLRVGG